MEASSVVRLWRQQSDDVRLCLSLAAGAFLAAAAVSAYSLYDAHWRTAIGMLLVGLFYLLRGAVGFKRRLVVAPRRSALDWRRAEAPVLPVRERITREAWENN